MAVLDGSASPGAWLTPAGIAGMDSTGKLGAGGEFHKQATQWMTPNVPNGGRSLPQALVESKGTTPEGKKRTVGLESQVMYWPRPVVTDSLGARNATAQRSDSNSKHHSGVTLNDAIRMWPSPTQRDGDARRGVTNPDSEAWKNKVARGAVNAAGMLSDDLKSSAACWPTPTAMDSEAAGGRGCIEAGNRGNTLSNTSQLWPTPAARDYKSAQGGQQQ